MAVFSTLSISKRITLAYLAFVFMPMCIFSYFSYKSFNSYSMAEYINANKNTFRQINDNLANKIENIKTLGDNICYNNNIKNFLQLPFSAEYDSINEYLTVISPIINNARNFQKQNIFNIRLFTTNSTIPGAGVFDQIRKVEKFDWYNAFMTSSDYRMWLDCAKAGKTNLWNSSLIACVQKIQSMNGECLGIVMILMTKSKMFHVSSPIDQTAIGQLILDNEEPVYAEGMSYSLPSIENYLKNAAGSEGYFKLKDVMYFHYNNQEIKYRFIYTVPLHKGNDTTKVFGFFIITVIVVLTILLVIFFFIINKVFSNINRHIRIIEDSVKAGFVNKIPVTRNDELGRISENFNRLLDKIHSLAKDMINKETAQKNAQLKSLQYQINPHFIYNTLNIFTANMELSGNYETADALSDFSRILRYNISSKTFFASLYDEVQIVLGYMAIQELKYKNQMKIKVNLPDELSRIRIIKFILQPIVENSIQHGYLIDSSVLDIAIDFFKEDNSLKIIVADNGRGMDQSTLERINNEMEGVITDESPMDDEHGIGLKNINERVKLFYGSQYPLKLESVAGSHTRVIITIPLFEGSHSYEWDQDLIGR